MKEIIIFLKGFLTIIIGMCMLITCIGAITTGTPFYMTTGIISIPAIIYLFIRFLKEHFRGGK